MALNMDDLLEQLLGELDAVDRSIERETALRLLQHLNLVLKANRKTNLTRITEPEEAVTLHIVDSLLLAPYVSGTIADMGSGAGFPGIPLSIAAGCIGTLIESSKRKAECLQSFVEELGLESQLSISHERIEEHANAHRGAYGTVTARALAATPILIEYASPLLSIGGRLVSTKGPQEEDRERTDRTLTLCGMEHVSRETIELPHGAGTRVIEVFAKTGEAEVSLPRRPGMANKRPLA